MVLRGFDLYWFRPDGNRKAKGSMSIPAKPITPCKIDGVQAFAIEKDDANKDGRKMEFIDN